MRLWSGPAPPSPDSSSQRARGQRIATALTLDGNTATLAADVALDAGGIGKGMALDRIASLLRGGGVEAAFLNFGGSSQLAVGRRPIRRSGWTRHRRRAGARLDAAASFCSRDAALSTSRSTGPGAKQGPIIDPRSGEPVTERRVATILAPDATTAEAWSKVPVIDGRAGVDAVRVAGLDVFYEDRSVLQRPSAFGSPCRHPTPGPREPPSSIDPLVASLPLGFAQHELLDLPRRRLRQVGESDRLRALEVRDA